LWAGVGSFAGPCLARPIKAVVDVGAEAMLRTPLGTS
jgi:hypothetical protein